MNDQWEFLLGAGLGRGFTGTWVGSGETNAVADLLGADLTSLQDCDLETAMAYYRPMSFTERIWAGPHADGWTHVLTISGPPPVTSGLTEAGLRFLQIHTVDAQVHDLLYGDGVATAWATQRWYGEVIVDPGSMLEPYLREVGRPAMPEAVHSGSWITEPEFHGRICLEIYLFLAGRMSGRFIDREWLGKKRHLYTVTPPSLEHDEADGDGAVVAVPGADREFSKRPPEHRDVTGVAKSGRTDARCSSRFRRCVVGTCVGVLLEVQRCVRVSVQRLRSGVSAVLWILPMMSSSV